MFQMFVLKIWWQGTLTVFKLIIFVSVKICSVKITFQIVEKLYWDNKVLAEAKPWTLGPYSQRDQDQVELKISSSLV